MTTATSHGGTERSVIRLPSQTAMFLWHHWNSQSIICLSLEWNRSHGRTLQWSWNGRKYLQSSLLTLLLQGSCCSLSLLRVFPVNGLLIPLCPGLHTVGSRFRCLTMFKAPVLQTTLCRFHRVWEIPRSGIYCQPKFYLSQLPWKHTAEPKSWIFLSTLRQAWYFIC